MSDNVNDRGFDPEDYRVTARLKGSVKNEPDKTVLTKEHFNVLAKQYLSGVLGQRKGMNYSDVVQDSAIEEDIENDLSEFLCNAVGEALRIIHQSESKPNSPDSKLNTGGQAFPVPNSDVPGSYMPAPGMTLRDYFAAAALQGILSCARDYGNCDNLQSRTMIAIRYADEMIRQLEI